METLIFPGFSEILTGILAILFGLYVILHDHKKDANILFFLFCLVITGRCIGDGGSKLFAYLYDVGSGPILSLDMFFSAYIATVGFNLCLAYPNGYPKWVKKWHIFLIYLPATYFAYQAVFNINFFFDPIYSENNRLVKVRNYGYLMFTFHTFINLLLSGSTFIIKYLKDKNPLSKKQVKAVIPGVWVGGLVVIFPGLLLSYFGYHISAVEIGMLTILAFIGLGVIRYQAFDIRTAIHYTLFWLTCLTVFLLPLAGVPLIADIHNVTSPTRMRLGLIFWGAASVGYYILLNELVFPKIRNITLRKKIELDREVRTFVNESEFSADIPELQNRLNKTFQKTVYPSDTVLLIRSKRTRYAGQFETSKDKVEVSSDILDEFFNLPNVASGKILEQLPLLKSRFPDIKLVARISFEKELLGWIFLKERKNLKDYTLQDVRFVEAIASVTGSTIHKFYQLKNAKEVTSEIVHELRNTSVGLEYTVAHLASKESLSMDEKEMLQEILIEMSKLHKFSRKHLSSEMVDKIDAVELKPIRLDQLIKNAAIPNKQKLKEKNVGLDIKFDPSFSILGDETLLKIVLANIIENAVKFLDKPKDIEIYAEDQGGFSVIRVVDYGPGISPDKTKVLAKGWLDRDGKYMSTGFGLSLCNKIIGRHNGTLDVSGEDNVGTTVVLKLPKQPVLQPAS